MHLKHQVGLVLLLLAAAAATAQPADALRASVETAVTTNPELAVRFNAYRASVDAVDVARAGYLPRLDMNASVGRDWGRNTGPNADSTSLSRSSAGLSLTQLLWDGLGTRNDVARFGHERLTRYFELLDATEQLALEAARAHIDVLRYRRLVQLAEDNYVQHRFAFLQIDSRVKAGVGRGVDLEQANARGALAESNLTAELANLHDVTARYQRIVGMAPRPDMAASAPMRTGIPGSAQETLASAAQRSAAVSASIENLRAARSLVAVRESTFQPRVEARLRSSVGKNLDGIENQSRNSGAEIVLNWNLFNGGADQARVRQQTNLLNQAADLRDKACRDVRQTAGIAFNDTRKLADQIAYLERNTLAIEKARDAYRQQFDIGQRSLLDVLNAENEVYTARRAFANAEYDLSLAYVRTHAALQQLLAQLGIARVESSLTDAAPGWNAENDAPTRCPLIVADARATERRELDARADRMATKAPVAAPAPAPRAPPLPAAPTEPRRP